MSAVVRQVTIPNTEVQMVSSSHVDQTFKILIGLPRRYIDSSKAYPVLYVLDANGEFGIVVETARLLRFGQEIPEVIVVGIGYPVGGFFEASGLRARDLTPTEDREWEEVSPEQYPDFLPPVGTGGAEDFLQFIREDLTPFVESSYRTNGDQTLVGHSFGGLFALYTLFHHPEIFNRYVIGSPAIWWDGAVTLKYAVDFSANNLDLSARVFMSVGSEEESMEAPDGSAMVTNVHRLAKMLRDRNYKSLRLKTFIFEGETHFSVIPATISRGLRSVFD